MENKPRKEVWTLNPGCHTGKAVVKEIKTHALKDPGVRKAVAMLRGKGRPKPPPYVKPCSAAKKK
jgi:hypothetical protein